MNLQAFLETDLQSSHVHQTNSPAGRECKPRQLRQWLSRLPWIDPVETHALMLERLQIFRDARLAAEVRAQLMHCMQPVLEQLFSGLRKPLREARLPLSDRNKQVFRLLIELISTTIANYQQLLLDQIRENHHNRHLHPALSRLAQWSAKQMLLHFQCYQQIPAKSWRRLHLCYLYGEKLQLACQPLDDAGSIKQYYLQALLTAYMDPYHFAMSDVENLFQLLAVWHEDVIIRPLQTPLVNGCFAVDLNLDAPTSKSLNQGDPQRYRSVDTRLLAARLKRLQDNNGEFIKLPVSDQTVVIHKSLLESVNRLLLTDHRRQCTRNACCEQVNPAIGLTAISRHLGNGGLPAVDQYWLMMDESDHGYRFMWQFPHATAARIGDVIAFELKGRGPRLAVIRWIKQVENFGLTIGVETLSQHIKGALIAASPSAEKKPALILSLDRLLTQGNQPEKLHLYQGARTVHISLSERVANTTRYNIYQARFPSPARAEPQQDPWGLVK